ncbi:Hypothetical protein NGAL_HAMBI2605_59360 [Neorhizobium galegae bv. orientalis]|nr:Hypothetical protein NGAL_HAMBI2605_59360 [Neorhizobium galegae bv. orientalis]
MSRNRAHCYGCLISKDPAENTRAHQKMIDELNAEIDADGWPGVIVTLLRSRNGRTDIQIEPGENRLTLDYLRQLRAAGRLPDAHPEQPDSMPPPGQQKLLL